MIFIYYIFKLLRKCDIIKKLKFKIKFNMRVLSYKFLKFWGSYFIL